MRFGAVFRRTLPAPPPCARDFPPRPQVWAFPYCKHWWKVSAGSEKWARLPPAFSLAAGHLCGAGRGQSVLGGAGPVCWGGCTALVTRPVFSSSQRVHGHQEEVQVPVLQLLGHAPVHPQAPHALPHGRAALPLRDLREEVHAAGAHEAAHAGERVRGARLRGQGSSSGRRGSRAGVLVREAGRQVGRSPTGSSEVGSAHPTSSRLRPQARVQRWGHITPRGSLLPSGRPGNTSTPAGTLPLAPSPPGPTTSSLPLCPTLELGGAPAHSLHPGHMPLPSRGSPATVRLGVQWWVCLART